MSGRYLLPQRRLSETFELKHGEQNAPFTVTTGFYQDGTVGEVFINGPKSGSDMAAVTHDGAILLSLALQHGVPLNVIKHAVRRNADGKASTIIGAVVDRISS